MNSDLDLCTTNYKTFVSLKIKKVKKKIFVKAKQAKQAWKGPEQKE